MKEVHDVQDTSVKNGRFALVHKMPLFLVPQEVGCMLSGHAGGVEAKKN